MKTIAEAMNRALCAPVYEPVPRNKDGVHFIRHRFPIKGGISTHEVLKRQLYAHNPLWEKFVRDATSSCGGSEA